MTTQYNIPSGKRPDISILSPAGHTLVESKLGSGFGDTQIQDYLDYLAEEEGRRALVLLTRRSESIPPDLLSSARTLGVHLVSRRWHDMAGSIAEPGEESLRGDFVHLLIREGLVKPEPFTMSTWNDWNAGYNVLLRADAFLEELDPLVKHINNELKKSGSGLTKRWIYRVWRGAGFELGLGLAASGGFSPHDPPEIFAFVGKPEATIDEAVRAVGTTLEKRYDWHQDPESGEWRGLLYDWPCVSRKASEVLTAATFEDQVAQGFSAHACNCSILPIAWIRARLGPNTQRGRTIRCRLSVERTPVPGHQEL